MDVNGSSGSFSLNVRFFGRKYIGLSKGDDARGVLSEAMAYTSCPANFRRTKILFSERRALKPVGNCTLPFDDFLADDPREVCSLFESQPYVSHSNLRSIKMKYSEIPWKYIEGVTHIKG